MATRNSDLNIRINGDASGLSKALGTAGSGLKKFATAGGAALAAGLAAAAGAAIAGGIKLISEGIRSGIKNEAIQTKLANTIKNTGEVTGVTVDMVNRLANEMQKLTRFEDDNVSAAGEVISRYRTIGKDVFPEVLMLSADLAESLGVDITDAATMMGKALAEPGEGLRVLKQAGVALDDQTLKNIDSLMAQGKVAEAQVIIMDALKSSIGGVALAGGQTLGGTLDRIKNQFGGVADSIGAALVPALQPLATFLSTYLSGSEFQLFIVNLSAALKDLGMYLSTNLPMWIGQLRQFFAASGIDQQQVINGLILIIKGLAIAFAGVAITVAWLVGALGPAWQAIQDLNKIMGMLALYLNIQLTKAFAAFMQTPFMRGAKAAFVAISDAIYNIVNAVKQVIAWFAKLPSAIPSWLIPGSPTPFEIGLRGISSELDNISKKTLPSITGGVSFQAGSQNNGASEMAGIRDEIKFLVRTLPRAIANANA